MSDATAARSVIEANGGLAKTSDLVRAGIPYYKIEQLYRSGDIIRVKQGYYSTPDRPPASEMLLIRRTVPRGVISVESALYHHGYIPSAPPQWSLTVPRNYSRTVDRAQGLNIKVYYVSDEHLDLGKTTALFRGVELAVYDRERTVCDCFRYRSKIDGENFRSAVRAYAGDGGKDLSRLAEYAREFHVYDKVMGALEAALRT